ncbi:hypothetical protein SAMN02745248_00012 [Hathewaya proteolytica DSM 3090]|uniref:Uncharacterized protein n=1 Tax=Hathewaya proteolytica DSM 3090 TaxID=1121331 RepID=A0A1M6J1Y9_9CLOT|nr:hypothetical protein [Hathewaya proteolytica]SHJ40705.1 hypothetical protein SAMN02745248_00012 [Hathewaya proteolytica DSM 3090]
MEKEVLEKMKKLIEEKKKKSNQGNLPRPEKTIGHAAKGKRNKKTGGVFDK